MTEMYYIVMPEDKAKYSMSVVCKSREEATHACEGLIRNFNMIPEDLIVYEATARHFPMVQLVRMSDD